MHWNPTLTKKKLKNQFTRKNYLHKRFDSFAVKGKVYDVTDNSHWVNGNHHGFEAGHDLTDPLYNKSPHGDSVLSKIKQIGVIKD